MKKNTNRRNGIPYTPGRNMYGQKAETHLIVLKRETALQQMLDAVRTLDGSDKEFTFDMRCFIGHEAEAKEIMKIVQVYMQMRASFPKSMIA
jgi:hypothetical protein